MLNTNTLSGKMDSVWLLNKSLPSFTYLDTLLLT